jgi:membrane protein required for beta-lactamase induction
MRFSIRDLMWLMAVVALIVTVGSERLAWQRQNARWHEERARREQETAAELADRDARIRGVREQNALHQHQIVVLLEQVRELEARAAEREAAVRRKTRLPALPAEAVLLPALPEGEN